MRGVRFSSASSRIVCHVLAQVRRPFREGDAAFQQETAHLVDDGGASLHEPVAHPVHGLQVELLVGLNGNKTHVLAGDGFGDGDRASSESLSPQTFYRGPLCTNRYLAGSILLLRTSLADMRLGVGIKPSKTIEHLNGAC